MMTPHKCSDFSSEIHHYDEEEKYSHHKSPSMSTSPLFECRVIRLQILCLKDRESSDDSNKKECKNTWFGYPTDHIWSRFRESFLEHIESGKEYDKESYPLYAWIFFEFFCYPSRSRNHEYDRYDKSDEEIYYISMTGTCYSEDIIETHSDISDDDRLYCSFESGSSFSSSMFIMFIRTDLSIEFPYDIEEEYRTEEFETRNLKQKYYSEWKNNTEYRRASNSPEDSFLTYFWRDRKSVV